jgi:hypothetical protein
VCPEKVSGKIFGDLIVNLFMAEKISHEKNDRCGLVSELAPGFGNFCCKWAAGIRRRAVLRTGLTPALGEYPPGEYAYNPGDHLLEYYPKEPVKCPDSPFFRILQDSMSEMQDSNGFFMQIFHLSPS